MNKEQLQTKLVKVGMAEKEARIYIAMLEKPEMSAGDLHRMAGVARSKIYDILGKMLAKGYCQERVEKNHRFFKAVQPSILGETLKHRWDAEFSERQHASDEALTFLQSKFEKAQQADRSSLSLIEILRNIQHIQQRYLSLVNDTKEELLTFNRSPYACLDPKVLDEQEKASIRLLEKGVSLKALYMWEDSMKHWLNPTRNVLLQAGEESRITDYLPIKMMVFDRKKILLALSDLPAESQADFTMIVIEDSGLIRSFLFLFDSIWDKAHTFDDYITLKGIEV